MTNHERVYENIRPWLRDCDLTAAAARLGFAPPDGGAVRVLLLGREFLVANDGVTQISGAPCHVNFKSVLIWYFTFGGSGEPSYEFAALHSFSHGIFGGQSSDFSSHDWRGYAGLTPDAFAETSARIGAELFRRERYGESRLLHVLPKIPALLTFSEADEEFAAQINIKFGSNSTSFLPFETLAVLSGLISSEYRNE
jgi:hypothetical protein